VLPLQIPWHFTRHAVRNVHLGQGEREMTRPLILVADDEKNIRNAIKLFLQEDRYAFIEAETGKDTIEIAKKYKPDLILLDILMPEGDGFYVCKELKSNPETQKLQIVMLTVKQDGEAISKSIELGADDYVTKPFSKELLRNKVEQMLLGGLIDAIVPDRRRTIRKIYPLSVTWGWRRGHIFEVEFKTKMIDISSTGFSFEHSRCGNSARVDSSHRQCPLSEFGKSESLLVLTFMIEFPDQKVIEVQGAVRHVFQQADSPDLEKVGVEFVGLPAEVRKLIEEFVNK
jgi:CheY-like chemotaxis protein